MANLAEACCKTHTEHINSNFNTRSNKFNVNGGISCNMLCCVCVMD